MHNNNIIIFASDLAGGIGYKGKLPWHVSEDLKKFKEVTDKKALIMGKKTYESMIEAGVVWGNRRPLVITRDYEYEVPEGQRLDPRGVMEILRSEHPIVIIGGLSLFSVAEVWDTVEVCYQTLMHKVYLTDTRLDAQALDYLENHFSREFTQTLKPGVSFIKRKRVK
jgi:dihydrofolate reductase